MEYETTIEETETEVIVRVPIIVPKTLWDSGANEKLAYKRGYKDTIFVQKPFETVDPETGETIVGEQTVEEPNPETPLEFNSRRIRDFVKEDYRSIVAEQGAQTGREQALSEFDSAFQ